MKIEEAWKNMEAPAKDFQEKELKMSMNHQPNDLMKKLNKQLGWKVFFIVFFMPLYTVGLKYFDELLIKALNGLILLVHILGLWFFVKRWKESKSVRLDVENSKETLLHYVQRVEGALRMEERVGLFLYPFAAAAGFFIGIVMNEPLEDTLQDQGIWIALTIAIVIITPSGWWAAKKMNNYSFGRYIQQLKDRLADWEEEG